MVTKKKTITQLKYRVTTTAQDILDGIEGCQNASRCMERIANVRALQEQFDVMPHESKVRIDAGHIQFCLRGYRWKGETPKVPRRALIDFDRIIRQSRRKLSRVELERLLLENIKPHIYTVTAIRGGKIKEFSRERKNQINAARRARYAAGERPKRYTLRQRVIGFR